MASKAKVEEAEELMPLMLEAIFWDSIEKKWSWNHTVEFEQDELNQLEDFIQENFDDILSYSSDYRWNSMEFGNKKEGRARVFSGDATYEDEDDYGNCFYKPVKLIAIVNIDMPKKKYISLRRGLQSLVKAGGFVPKKNR